MSARIGAFPQKKRWVLSLDGWAVTAALLAALLIRFGILKHVPS